MDYLAHQTLLRNTKRESKPWGKTPRDAQSRKRYVQTYTPTIYTSSNRKDLNMCTVLWKRVKTIWKGLLNRVSGCNRICNNRMLLEQEKRHLFLWNGGGRVKTSSDLVKFVSGAWGRQTLRNGWMTSSPHGEWEKVLESFIFKSSRQNSHYGKWDRVGPQSAQFKAVAQFPKECLPQSQFNNDLLNELGTKMIW